MIATAAEAFLGDERITRARALIMEALADHQQRLDGPRPPHPERLDDYQRALASLERMRGRPLFHRFLGSGFGRGVLVEMGDGSVKYDLVSGIGVHCFGHSHPGMVEAALEAALCDIIMQGAFHQNVETEAVGRALITCANRGGAALEHCFFATSGAMANENALKMALQKRAPAGRLLAFRNCFAGRTLMLSHVTDTPGSVDGLPGAVPVDRVPFYDPARPGDSLEEALAALNGHLSAHPGAHAAMVFELIQGEAGYYPGSREFFVPLMQRLRDEGIAVVVDEIQTFGRTTEPFAFQYYGLDSLVDIVTIGKISQVCATLYTAAWNPRPGLISATFTSSTAGLLALRVILDALTDGGLCGPQGAIARLHGHFVKGLEGLAAEFPGQVSGPWGIGSMLAFTVFDGSADRTRQFVRALFDRGVIAFITDGATKRVRFHLPVGAMTFEDVDAAMAIIRDTVIACR
jgi:4-aminobutyrate aminotransferase-like enzyme